MAIAVLLVSLISFFIPSSALWIELSWINYFLMIVMLGMGLMISPKDFLPIFTNPKDILIGIFSQYLFMPFLAFILCYIFKLDVALTVGVVLVGACPGATSSNIMTFIAKGDSALSIVMTSVNTLLSPILTPFITLLLLKTSVDVDAKSMFLGIVYVILIPIILGFILNYYFKNITSKILKIFPMISCIAICLLIASVVSHNADKILQSGLSIILVLILLNFLGYFFGFLVGKLFRMPLSKIKALSLQVGMQNAGLATSLATTSFPTLQMATVPGALFTIFHNFSGAVLASIFKKK